jgi:hypothetical protein
MTGFPAMTPAADFHVSKGGATDVCGPGQMSVSGGVLAGRFEYFKGVGTDSFEAYDLELDQPVIVRQILRARWPDEEAWLQKLRELAHVRNPHFLNILDVAVDQAHVFLIAEYPQGPSISQLLSGRPHLELREVLALIGPVAAAIDFAGRLGFCHCRIATTSIYAERATLPAETAGAANEPDWESYSLKIDLWELLKPKSESVLVDQDARRSSRASARQTAHLLYELLAGEEKAADYEKEHWFQPIAGIGGSANALLLHVLEASREFRSSVLFLREFNSACAIPEYRRKPERRIVSKFSGSPSAESKARADRPKRFDSLGASLSFVTVLLILTMLFLWAEQPGPRNDEKIWERAEKPLILGKSEVSKAVSVQQESANTKPLTTPPATPGDLPADPSGNDHRSAQESDVPDEVTVAPASPDFDTGQPGGKATFLSPASQRKVRADRHQTVLRSKVTDAKARLLALWHKSLRQMGISRSQLRLWEKKQEALNPKSSQKD